MTNPEQPTASQPQQPYNSYAPAPQPMQPSDERLWSTLIHLSGILLGASGFGFVGPLIGFLVLKDRGPFVRAHTAAALNFQISFVIYAIGVTLIMFVTFGFGALLFIPLGIVYLIFTILAAVAAHRGQYYKFPITIEFVR